MSDLIPEGIIAWVCVVVYGYKQIVSRPHRLPSLWVSRRIQGYCLSAYTKDQRLQHVHSRHERQPQSYRIYEVRPDRRPTGGICENSSHGS
jgi:hypothetical protein